MPYSSQFAGFYSYISDIFTLLANAFYNSWHYVLYTTSDKQPITLANIIVGLLLLTLSIKLARKFSLLMRKKVLNTMNIDDNIRVILETVFRYLFMIFSTLIVLDICHVPLTSFTLIGSALAIGVGLGSQHITNNFISGLIIMIEQPIRVGDYVEVEQVLGRVVNIGARCINLITSDNMDVLIPNSMVLQNKVVNWTLSDNKVRLSLNIPVHFDINSVEASQAILDIATQNQDIAEFPRPQVYFNSYIERHRDMNFELCVWLDFTKCDRRKVISDLHHSIRIALNNFYEGLPNREL